MFITSRVIGHVKGPESHTPSSCAYFTLHVSRGQYITRHVVRVTEVIILN